MAGGLELRDLECFVAAARELNFTRAAERVFMTQPALSQKVARLERTLGVPLFVRGARGVALTAAGVAMLEGAGRILEAARELEREVRAAGGAESGRVRLGYVEYALQQLAPPILAALVRRHPGVAVEPVEMPSFEIARALNERRIDVGFGMRPIAGRGVRTRRMADGEWLAVVPREHRLASAERLSLASLAGERILLFARALNPRVFDAFVARCRAAGFEPDVAYQGVQAHVGPRMVAEGLGVLVIASWALPDLPPGVVVRTIDDVGYRLALCVAWRTGDDSPVTRTLVEAAVTHSRALSGHEISRE
jgi:DNA-binding transcriptional LysR family regulator